MSAHKAGACAWMVAGAIALVAAFCRPAWADEPADAQWTSLFDGESLGEWEPSEFGFGGEIRVEEGRIVLSYADGCNGVTYRGEFPTQNYELRLQAQRVDGTDFFCGLTFPVGEEHLSFIVGGWGGAIVGISSLEGLDAAENETTHRKGFKSGCWYDIRIRVTDERLQAWIEDEQMVDVALAGRKLSIRPEVERSKPLGICSWCTTAALRNIEWRPVAADEEESPPE